MIDIPDSALDFGFVKGQLGPHASRTMMLAELRLLLAAYPPASALDDYRQAVIADNVLLKRTDSNRKQSFGLLRQLYGLSPDVILFRALRDLWDADVRAQPLLALLCCLARDRALRATVSLILATPPGGAVTSAMLSASVREQLGAGYSTIQIEALGQHIASTYRQAGHLGGLRASVRTAVDARPSAVAYALLLGYLTEAQGEFLFATPWVGLLDTSEPVLRELAFAASQRGWLEYRHVGGVTEVGFRHLLRERSAAVA